MWYAKGGILRPSVSHSAAQKTWQRHELQGVLVSSYCCSTYRVADPFSSLGTFSSSSIWGPMIHPIADCEHPLLYWLGPGIVSQETAISGSFQQNLPMLCYAMLCYAMLCYATLRYAMLCYAMLCYGVSIWKLIMGWIPGIEHPSMYIISRSM
jgi:hypothetical protein